MPLLQPLVRERDVEGEGGQERLRQWRKGLLNIDYICINSRSCLKPCVTSLASFAHSRHAKMEKKKNQWSLNGDGKRWLEFGRGMDPPHCDTDLASQSIRPEGWAAFCLLRTFISNVLHHKWGDAVVQYTKRPTGLWFRGSLVQLVRKNKTENGAGNVTALKIYI